MASPWLALRGRANDALVTGLTSTSSRSDHDLPRRRIPRQDAAVTFALRARGPLAPGRLDPHDGRSQVGEQARETEQFVAVLRGRVQVPVETFDERFTTTLAARSSAAAAPEDTRAAAHLLESYLARSGR